MSEAMSSLPAIAPFDRLIGHLAAGVTRQGSHDKLTFHYCSPFEDVFLVTGEAQDDFPNHVRVPGPGMITLMFMLRGGVIMSADGDEWQIPANAFAIMFRPKDKFYDILTPRAPGLLVLSVHMSVEVLKREPFKRGFERFYGGVLDMLSQDARLLAMREMTHEVRTLALQTANTCRSGDDARPLVASIHVLELFDRLGAMAGQENGTALKWVMPSKGDLDRLLGVKRIIEAQYSENLTVARLAREASMSESKLTHCFHAAFGAPPMTYLQSVRIERAKTMLSTTDATIGQVAWSTGYRHQCNFAVAFKRATGVSPKHYRLQAHAQR